MASLLPQVIRSGQRSDRVSLRSTYIATPTPTRRLGPNLVPTLPQAASLLQKLERPLMRVAFHLEQRLAQPLLLGIRGTKRKL